MPILSEILNAVGGPIVNSITGLIQGKKNREASLQNTELSFQKNKELADYEYGRNVDMWNKANQYNAPEAQMDRLKKAGLNPNLVYGQGAVGNTASQLPKYQAPQVQYNAPAGTQLQGFQEFGNVLQQYQDYKLKNAQIDNVRAQKTQIDQAVLNAQVMGRVLSSRLEGLGFANKIQENRARYSDATLDREINYKNAMFLYGEDAARYQPDIAAHRVDLLTTQANKFVQDVLLSQQLQEESKSRVSLNRQRSKIMDQQGRNMLQQYNLLGTRNVAEKMNLENIGWKGQLLQEQLRLMDVSRHFKEMQIDNNAFNIFEKLMGAGTNFLKIPRTNPVWWK